MSGDDQATAQAWEAKYRTIAALMREQPEHHWAKKFRLDLLAADPPLEFKIAFLTAWDRAANAYEAGVPARIYNSLVLQAERIVIRERVRQIETGASPAAAQSAPPIGKNDPGYPDAAAVLAERARRISDRDPSGYPALAKHFKVGPSTIRRRLGKLAK